MSAYSLLLHAVACLWYVFFWNNYLSNGQQHEGNWDPKYQDIHEMGCRFLTNWNLVSYLIYFEFLNFIQIISINLKSRKNS